MLQNLLSIITINFVLQIVEKNCKMMKKIKKIEHKVIEISATFYCCNVSSIIP